MMGLIAGTKLGRYEIREQIGAGGMGEVYLALDTELDRTVAIKILPEALASDQRGSLAIIYGGLGDKDRAFQWLERSYRDHANELSQLKFDPLLDNLRSDPRFTDLVRRVGL